ncbi:MAG TPA: efflux RND transporter periplasmic adaptor subunit [Gallionellaceae bacterium]|nr:efflux RND transporter periplasmic adaptor subunit [Gallionellaceae bacterium]
MRHPSIKILLLLSLAILLLGGLLWWLLPAKADGANRYALASVERGSLTQTVSANGTLNPVKLVNVGSQVSGIVKKLYVDFNDRVKAGQILLELDPSLMQAQLQQSLANVANAEAQLDLASANETRMRGLYAQEYVTRQELDQAVQALKSARAQLALAQAQAARDRTNLSNTIIRSPVSGVVVSRVVDTGQTVAASLQAPTLFTIAQDLRKMQIDTSYAEADVGAIHVGQAASFRVDAFPNRLFKGEVRQVRLNPTSQQNVVTYDVVVSVNNDEQLLMPGMTAYVNITVAQRKDVLLLPNAALRFRPADAGARAAKARTDGKQEVARGKDKSDSGPAGTVYLLENGQPKPVRVAVGITDNRFTELPGSELTEGSSVIVEDRQPPSKSSGGPGMRLF